MATPLPASSALAAASTAEPLDAAALDAKIAELKREAVAAFKSGNHDQAAAIKKQVLALSSQEKEKWQKSEESKQLEAKDGELTVRPRK